MQFGAALDDLVVRKRAYDFIYFSNCPLNRFEHLKRMFIYDVGRPRNVIVRKIFQFLALYPAGICKEGKGQNTCCD